MRYHLMHKRVPVTEITIDDETAAIINVGKMFAPEHLPIGVGMIGSQPDKESLNDWWNSRAIPASRSGLREALEILQVSYSKKLLTKCLGLSLSDQYWVNPMDHPVEWDTVNFFDNAFTDDVGDALFGRTPEHDGLSLMSPDNTSDGWLRKKWKIIDGTRCLIKGGSNPFQQEPLNEVMASAVCRRLNIPHVTYDVIWNDDRPFSICPDFITPQTELVSAWRIMQSLHREMDISLYQHYLNCCCELGIPGVREQLNAMLTLDFLIVNEDRHLNNFGAVRDAETLEWLGPAPIYDSGTSLWHDQLFIGHSPRQTPSKPFRNHHMEQIQLATSFERFDMDALEGIDEEFNQILSASPFINEERREGLCQALRRRKELLYEITQTMEPEPEIGPSLSM